jgi:hypothetical protein
MADEVAGISFRLDLSDRYLLSFIQYWITHYGGIVCDDGGLVVSDAMPRDWNVLRVSQMQFAFDGSHVSSSPFTCRITVFATAGPPVIPAAVIVYPELVVFPMAEAGYSPFRGLFDPPQNPDRGLERRKFVGAVPSGYCCICRVEYTDSQEHRSSLLHLRRREADNLWIDFDDLARRVKLLM